MGDDSPGAGRNTQARRGKRSWEFVKFGVVLGQVVALGHGVGDEAGKVVPEQVLKLSKGW